MNSARVEGQIHRFPGEEITWAGDCPCTGTLCFGTESGKVLIDMPTPSSSTEFLEYQVSGEAINGVAFWKRYMGVSTRSDVSVHFLRMPLNGIDPLESETTGAHDILATLETGVL